MQQEAMCIASIFGPFLILQGLWLLFYRDSVVKVWTSFRNTAGAYYLLSFMNVFLGLILLHMYNTWTADMAVFVTVVGWLILLRGLIAVFIPQMFMKMLSNKWITPCGVITLVLGLFLGWFALGMS